MLTYLCRVMLLVIGRHGVQAGQNCPVESSTGRICLDKIEYELAFFVVPNNYMP